MILYDAHQWRFFLQFRGSVLPKAWFLSIPSSIISGLLAHFIPDMTVFQSSDGTAVFTSVLGFCLVFRASQAYTRYWRAATAVHEMSAEWLGAISSLIAFVQITKQPQIEIPKFVHTLVRLFSLAHAMALQDIAVLKNEDFPIVDPDGLDQERLSLLDEPVNEGRKVEIVFMWIQTYVTECMDNGLLNVPAPILTRVYAELQTGIVRYHEAQQVVMWPFPFPYAQMTLCAIMVYAVFLPFGMQHWTVHWGMAVLFTSVTMTFMFALDLIAAELDMPFGEDDNDLPMFQMQIDMNRSLVGLTDHRLWAAPGLQNCAIMSFDALLELERNEFPDDGGRTKRKSLTNVADIYLARSVSAFFNGLSRKQERESDARASCFKRPRPSTFPQSTSSEDATSRMTYRDLLNAETFDEDSFVKKPVLVPSKDVGSFRTASSVEGDNDFRESKQSDALEDKERKKAEFQDTHWQVFLDRLDKTLDDHLCGHLAHVEDYLKKQLDQSSNVVEKQLEKQKEINAPLMQVIEQMSTNVHGQDYAPKESRWRSGLETAESLEDEPAVCLVFPQSCLSQPLDGRVQRV